MPRAATWVPRHVAEPVPQDHEVRSGLVRDVPELTGPQFRARRTALGLNHSHVAIVCAVATRTITRWEALPGAVPEVACEQLQAVAEASATYYAKIAENGGAVIYSYGWRVLPESGLCLPETWWHTVAGMVPDAEIVWAKGHPAAVPNNEAARRRAAKKASENGTGAAVKAAAENRTLPVKKVRAKRASAKSVESEKSAASSE